MKTEYELLFIRQNLKEQFKSLKESPAIDLIKYRVIRDSIIICNFLLQKYQKTAQYRVI